jgi:hypothetical protein
MLPSAPRYLFLALYAAAALILLDQIAELVVVLYPFRLSAVDWRFGAFGLIMGRTTTAVIMDVLIILATLGLRHRRALRIWGMLHVVAALLLLIGLVMFALDALELRGTVRPDVMGTLTLGSTRAALMVFLALIYCGLVTAATLRASRRGAADKGADESPLLVGRI